MPERIKRLRSRILTRYPIPCAARVQQPAHPEPVGPIAVQHAGSFRSVKIHSIGIGNNSQLCEIKVRVPALQRIVRPSHLANTQPQRPFPLRMLQLQPEIVLPITLQHRQHVRVNRSLPVFPSKDPEREPDHLVAVKRSHENAPGRFAGNRQRHREAVIVRHPPDFFLHRFHLAEIVEALQIPDNDELRCAAHVHLRPVGVGAEGAYQRPAAASSRSICRKRSSDRLDCK